MSQFQYITLNNNLKIPPIGFGSYCLDNPKENVLKALNKGYRLIDTAARYGCETEVGQAINEFLKNNPTIKREDLFVVTKLWITDFKDPVNALKESLKKLNLTYVDSYLIHQPYGPVVDGKFQKKEPLYKIWNDMEKCVELGLTKSIGVSNFNSQILMDLCSYAKILPVLNQVEIHPWLQQKGLINNMKFLNNIVIMSFYPYCIGKRGVEKDEKYNLLKNEVILELCKKYNKKPIQIILNWHMNQKIIPLTKSTNIEHISENFDVQFKMDDEDYKKIDALDLKHEFRINNFYGNDWDNFA